MYIRLKNRIFQDGHTEIIDQTFPVDFQVKDGKTYLIYLNEDDERVILKLTDRELTMTRYSTPKSVMHFIRDDDAIVLIASPAGLHHFRTRTKVFHKKEHSLSLEYDLLPLEGEALFALYQLEIVWGEGEK